MAEYDLTSKVGGYLDRHLIFPLLEFLTEKKVWVVKWLAIISALATSLLFCLEQGPGDLEF